jgi:FAD/FMN-containing dehydrogenase
MLACQLVLQLHVQLLCLSGAAAAASATEVHAVLPPLRCCSIMMDKMTKVLSVDKDKKQLRVQAQMTLKDLYATADANDMSTPRSALPWWQGLTLAGVFSTSSHGTGNNATSMIVSALFAGWPGSIS